jgi:hypothetical protein
LFVGCVRKAHTHDTKAPHSYRKLVIDSKNSREIDVCVWKGWKGRETRGERHGCGGQWAVGKVGKVEVR